MPGASLLSSCFSNHATPSVSSPLHQRASSHIRSRIKKRSTSSSHHSIKDLPSPHRYHRAHAQQDSNMEQKPCTPRTYSQKKRDRLRRKAANAAAAQSQQSRSSATSATPLTDETVEQLMLIYHRQLDFPKSGYFREFEARERNERSARSFGRHALTYSVLRLLHWSCSARRSHETRLESFAPVHGCGD